MGALTFILLLILIPIWVVAWILFRWILKSAVRYGELKTQGWDLPRYIGYLVVTTPIKIVGAIAHWIGEFYAYEEYRLRRRGHVRD